MMRRGHRRAILLPIAESRTKEIQMIFMRRRPLMRAAVVGGAAYHVGKSIQSGRDQDAQQEAEIQDLQAQQQYAQAPAAPAGGGAMSDASIEQLKKLAELHDQGVLTDAEFEVQKQKLLQGM
jgi:hypothetical protein